MANDLLQKTKKATSTRKKAASKSDERWIVKVGQDDPRRSIVQRLVEVCTLSAELKPILDQLMRVTKDDLFDMWTQRMWDTKSVPDNPRIVLPKVENGKDLALEDHRCMLQIKFRSAGLQKVLPDSEELDEDQTVSEVLVETLVGVAGVSEKKARAFVDNEVAITDRMAMRDIAEMYYSSDDNEKSIATKILQFINQRSKAKNGKGSVELITDEEMDSLENGLFVTQQTVTIKDGMFERAWNYCDNIDQLRKLLRFCNVTIQVSNFEYALADTAPNRVQRLTKAAESYLLASDNE